MRTSIFGTNPLELGVNDGNRHEVLARIQADARYVKHFKAVFIDEADPTSWENIIKAIAAFERTLISADSRYVQSVAGKIALTEQEMRGQKLFFSDQAKCLQCHGSPNFNDQFSTAASVQSEPRFHNTGLFNMGSTGAYPEPRRGIYEITQLVQDMGKFRAASLRNIELTAPYMQDGSMATLEAVLDVYAAGGRYVGNGLYAGNGRLNPYRDARISQITLSEADKSDLVAFLKALTDIGFVTNASNAAPSP